MVEVDPRLFNLVRVLDKTADGGVVVGHVTNPRYDSAGNIVADITYLGTQLECVRIRAAEHDFPVYAVPSESDSPVHDQLREVAVWREAADQALRDRDFYRSIVTKIGEMFGDAAKTSDDGAVQQDVLALKVPECVQNLQREVAVRDHLLGGAQLKCNILTRERDEARAADAIRETARSVPAVLAMPHEFDSSRTCNYCGIAAERVGGNPDAVECPKRRQIEADPLERDLRHLYDALSEIRALSVNSSFLAGKTLEQRHVDDVDRIGSIANRLIGDVLQAFDRHRQRNAERGGGI